MKTAVENPTEASGLPQAPVAAVPVWDWAVMSILSALLVAVAVTNLITLPPVELGGFITGFVCVWLIVRNSAINWPVGLLNNILYFAFFLSQRLYAESALQCVFFALGVYGWWNWLHGREGTGLPVTRGRLTENVMIAGLVPLLTLGLVPLLVSVNGAAPFWDASIFTLSLCAQYLLCQRRIENWLLWITVDVICIPLYFSRGLYLSAGLYALFLVMCLVGLFRWSYELKRSREAQAKPIGQPETFPE